MTYASIVEGSGKKSSLWSGQGRVNGVTYQRFSRGSWWFDRLIDHMLAKPTASLDELSMLLGRTPSYISLVRGSDMFKLRYSQRLREKNAQLNQAINAGLEKVALAGLDEMARRLENQGGAIPFQKLAEATDSVLERLGYGRPVPGPTTQVTVDNRQMVVVPVSKEHLAEARASLRSREAENARISAASGSALRELPLSVEEEATWQDGPFPEGEANDGE
jgi:hypothetical protein